MKNSTKTLLTYDEINDYNIEDLNIIDDEMPFKWENNIEDESLDTIDDITWENDLSYPVNDQTYFYGY